MALKKKARGFVEERSFRVSDPPGQARRSEALSKAGKE